MPNFNKVMLMGYLTRDCELRYLPSNMAVVNLGLAINRRWKNQAGDSQEETTFVDAEAFGKTAEVLNKYVKKGQPLFIQGRLKLDQWQDRDGKNRSKLKVVIESFEFLALNGDNSHADSTERDQPPDEHRKPEPAAKPTGAARHDPVDEDDIPFD